MTPKAPISAETFTAKWAPGGSADALTERAGAQSHFLDLCELLGVAKPDSPDSYCFERGAKKTGAAGQARGWADVWKKSHFAWEYKAPGANLGTALKQLMTYALALDNPPLLVVSDRHLIQIHTHFTGTPTETHTIPIGEIDAPVNLQKLHWLFESPDNFKPQRTRTAITTQAAKLFGELAETLRGRGHAPQAVAHFASKLLFCFFAQDSGGVAAEPLLPERVFTRLLENGKKDAGRANMQLTKLFAAMAKPGGEFGLLFIDWFNGSLFDDDVVLPLKREDFIELLKIGSLDWSAIDPSIFGTLFERGLNPKKRAQLGAHYTDPQSIMRIVGPCVVEPLSAAWQVCRSQIAAHMETMHALENSHKAAEKAKATAALKEAYSLYRGYLDTLTNFRVLDPACGSGNFLYMALQALKDLEHKAMLEAEELGLNRELPQVGPECVLGIELDPYAAELARVTVWIGEIQWMVRHGYAPSREPILKSLNQIACRDALVEAGDQGSAIAAENSGDRPHEASMPVGGNGGGLSSVFSATKPPMKRATWPKVDAIVGNPPFLGGSRMRRELGDAYTESLRAAYEGVVPGGADLVTYWFAQAADALAGGQALRAGLVATNSIRMATNRPVLERIVDHDALEIFNAWSDEEWVNEGAAVRVSIVNIRHHAVIPAQAGIQNGVSLDGVPSGVIHANLTAGDASKGASGAGLQPSASVDADLTQAVALRENSGASFQGSQKIGAFDIPGELARAMLGRPNPHGKPNADVVKPSRNGLDVTRRARDVWIIDFGTTMTEADAALYQAPFEYVVEHVKPERIKNPRAQYVKNWWRHGEPRIALRSALQPLRRFIATPEVAKHRPFVWLDRAVLPDKMLIAIAREDDVTFGLLQSRMHVLWSLAQGGTLEDRPRYNPTRCFETFPFPTAFTPSRAAPDKGHASYAVEKSIPGASSGMHALKSMLRLPLHVPSLQTADQRHAESIALAAFTLNHLRERWLNPPEWVDVMPEVLVNGVKRYPDRVIPKPEFAKQIKERTLTKLYNECPTWLSMAHTAVDLAVAAAYGWADYSEAMPDAEILRRLLALNLERTQEY